MFAQGDLSSKLTSFSMPFLYCTSSLPQLLSGMPLKYVLVCLVESQALTRVLTITLQLECKEAFEENNWRQEETTNQALLCLIKIVELFQNPALEDNTCIFKKNRINISVFQTRMLWTTENIRITELPALLNPNKTKENYSYYTDYISSKNIMQASRQLFTTI